MSFKRFFKNQSIFSLVLSLPFLGLAADVKSPEVTPPSVECIQELSLERSADLVVKRLKLAEELAVYRWNNKLPLEPLDQKYIERLINQCQEKILDSEEMQKFFAAQIDAFQVMTMEHFEAWIAKGIHKHEYAPDFEMLQKKIEALDEQLLLTLNGVQQILSETQKEAFKISLSTILYEKGFSRDVIDAATHF